MGQLKTRYGDIYIGMWKNGLQHGNGKYIWKHGSIYQGQFANGNQVLSNFLILLLVSMAMAGSLEQMEKLKRVFGLKEFSKVRNPQNVS
jgi:hypothetical protein